MKLRNFWLSVALGLVFLSLPASGLGAEAPESAIASSLATAWSASGSTLDLKPWTLDELKKLKPVVTQERDSVSGKSVRWKGVPLVKLVEAAIQSLPLEQRAQVDLLVFKNAAGLQAVIPRSLITQVSVLLAFEKDHQPLFGPDAPFALIVPGISVPKIQKLGLPFAAYQISNVQRLDLSSYQSQYSSLLLKRRTDPAAIRGEKMVVQNCISCHGAGRASSIGEVSSGAARSLASSGHPKAQGAPELSSRDLRALVSYLDAYRNQALAHQAQKAIPAER